MSKRLRFLAPDVATRYTRRATLVHVGELRIASDGPVVAVGRGPLLNTLDLIVVEEGERPGVVLLDAGLRMFAVINPADLAEVVTRRVRVTDVPTGAPSADDTGVFLEIGAWPEITDRIDGWLRISGGCDPILHEGWIPADALGRIFDHQPEAEALIDATVAAGSRVFVGPGGRPLASFPGSESLVSSYPVELVGAVKRGFRKIKFTTQTCTVRGWVPTRHVDRFGAIEEIWGGGVVSTRLCGESSDTQTLAAGTLLAHTVGGVVFARMDKPLRLSRVRGTNDDRLCISTLWGPLEVRPVRRP